jgi:hypothetical protein
VKRDASSDLVGCVAVVMATLVHEQQVTQKSPPCARRATLRHRLSGAQAPRAWFEDRETLTNELKARINSLARNCTPSIPVECAQAGVVVAVSEKLSEKTPRCILAALAQNPKVTIADLAEIVGVSDRTIERHLKRLQAQGRFRRVGPAKGGHWEVLAPKSPDR